MPSQVHYKTNIVDHIRTVKEIRKHHAKWIAGTGSQGDKRYDDRIIAPKMHYCDEQALASPLPHVDSISDIKLVNAQVFFYILHMNY